MAEGSFKVWGKDYNLVKPDMGEMADAELEFQVDFKNPDRSSIRFILAMIWISIKRVDPTVSVEDIRRLPSEVFENMFDEVDDASPPEQTPENSNSTTVSSSANGANSESDPSHIGVPG